MSAHGTAEHDAAERREAARALLRHPVLTKARHGEELALVRRHAPALKKMFSAVLGYHLVVEASFARLVKDAPSTDAPPRPAQRRGGQPFAPRTYAYLALVCAGLLQTAGREQVLLGTLVEQVRADAAIAGIAMDDSLTDRRHLVQAIALLLDWGVLSETDGSVTAWGDRHEEALLEVNRTLLTHVLARPLGDVDTAEELLERGGRTAAEQARRALRRRLVENPLVRREDLTAEEQHVLSRERADLSRTLADHFGLTLEVRQEGALAYDVDGDLTDVAFPGQGTVAHVALLLVNALVDDLDGGPGATAEVDGRAVPGLLAPWAAVSDAVHLLVEQYGATFAEAFATDPEYLQAEVVTRLEELSLARRTPAGLVLHPACARYQPEPQRAPRRTPAPAAPAGGPDAAGPDAQQSLFPLQEDR
ncbi:TIGR02678 family protein [Georgenia ruanii]|uniref:TIGR02678 family protein n=1 Tax=Georgenia ruanii TaxID=348442 RepID=A0A7J9UYN9_9MICO|nr:TIGR02678 family protein [Georgenia ruanii]MPV88794.1 TIGR02678 family protein [Georgenia ruanii]